MMFEEFNQALATLEATVLEQHMNEVEEKDNVVDDILLESIDEDLRDFIAFTKPSGSGLSGCKTERNADPELTESFQFPPDPFESDEAFRQFQMSKFGSVTLKPLTGLRLKYEDIPDEVNEALAEDIDEESDTEGSDEESDEDEIDYGQVVSGIPLHDLTMMLQQNPGQSPSTIREKLLSMSMLCRPAQTNGCNDDARNDIVPSSSEELSARSGILESFTPRLNSTVVPGVLTRDRMSSMTPVQRRLSDIAEQKKLTNSEPPVRRRRSFFSDETRKVLLDQLLELPVDPAEPLSASE